MKRLVLVPLAVVPALAACVDLFHATSFETLCDRDASACGDLATDAAGADAAAEDPVDVCAASSEEALARARHACAWLGACLGPLGETTFGACMLRMQLAYDCAANPSLRPLGEAEALPRCLVGADTCDAVRACVLGEAAVPACAAVASGTFRACGAEGNVRAECGDSELAVGLEPCALTGRTCTRLDDSEALCLGVAGTSCATAGCVGTSAVSCRSISGGQVDVGIDCAKVGAGRCVAGACAPSSDATACTAPTMPACKGSVVEHCVDGRLARLDCAAFGLGCDAAAAQDGAWNLASLCSATPARCTAPDERCVGAKVTSCAHGAPRELDCAAEGLGPCRVTAGGAAACTPP